MKSGRGKTLGNALLALAAVCLSLVLGIGVAELALRVHQLRAYGIGILNDARHGLLTADARLGWRMTPNLRYRVAARDALDRAYELDVATDGRGFRSYGEPAAAGPKVFVVGDSFTAAVEVSNDKTYHGLLRQLAPGLEVFAYGAGGYGSLQEFMILDEHLDAIRPDLVLWQFHENDFLDNDRALDILKFLYNSGTPRPYLEPGGAVALRYATYGDRFWTLPAVVADNLRLLRLLNNRVSRMLNLRAGPGPGAGPAVAADDLARSEATTRAILETVKRRAGTTPVYLFPITGRQPYADAIRRICSSVGIGFIEGVARGLAEADRAEPLGTRAADREHLNERGNRVVAERLLEFLRAEGIPARPQSPARP